MDTAKGGTMAQIPLIRGKYVSRTMKNQRGVYNSCTDLTAAELGALFADYEHQFKNQELPILSKLEAWVWLQGVVSILMDRKLWDYKTRRPLKSKVDVTPDPDDFYAPMYGWRE